MSTTTAAPEGGKKRGNKWILIAATVAVLGAVAAGAAQFLGRPVLLGTSPVDAAAAAKKENPIFVSLEQFTVNLADEGGERFAQIAVTLEISDQEIDKAIRSRMPSIRNAVLLLMSSKKAGDLLSLEGKKLLAEQIALRAGAELGWQGASGGNNPVEAVHFSHFIVQ